MFQTTNEMTNLQLCTISLKKSLLQSNSNLNWRMEPAIVGIQLLQIKYIEILLMQMGVHTPKLKLYIEMWVKTC